jgi:hypothetical protein
MWRGLQAGPVLNVILSDSEGSLVHRAAGAETVKAFGLEREALRSTSG